MTGFAAALDVSPQTLNSYLSGKMQPGNKLQSKLREIGCDVEWLMTGKKDGKARKAEEAVTAFHAPAGMDPKVRKTIQKLLEDISDLPYGDVERARELIRAAFKKK